MLIIGNGPMRKRLKTLNRELKIVDRILFCGQVSHEKAMTMMAEYDIYVSTSIYELKIWSRDMDRHDDLSSQHARALTVFFDSLGEEKKGFYSLAELLQYRFLVIQKNQGKIIGISGVLPRNVLFLGVVPKNLFFLVMKSNYQNRGIGQKLTKKVIQKAIRRNYSHIALYVHRSNRKAIHIYLKLGFRTVYSPFMRTVCFMILPLNLMGWLFFPLLYIYFIFITPLKHLLKTVYDLFNRTSWNRYMLPSYHHS